MSDQKQDIIQNDSNGEMPQDDMVSAPESSPGPTAIKTPAWNHTCFSKDTCSIEPKTVKVIGAGWGRTGTLSLKTAMEILNLKCYHMVDVMENNDNQFWVDVSDGKRVDFQTIFGSRGYEATCDFPASKYYKQQMEAYPDAKVILTYRDPEKWYKSCCDTIFKACPQSGLTPLGFRALMMINTTKTKMITQVISRDSFNHDWSKENIIKCYLDHIADVRATVPPERLLEIDVTEGKGWKPICDFLDLPIPDVPFPKVNDTESFQQRISTANIMGWAISSLLLGIPLVMAAMSQSESITEDKTKPDETQLEK